MLDKLRHSKLMFWSIELLVIATLIFVSTKINFLFSPIATFFSTMFAPILIAGFLYYMLNPLVKLLMRTGLTRNKSIVIVFLLLFTAIVLVVLAVIPSLVKQIGQLINNVPSFVSDVEKGITELLRHPLVKDFDINSYLDKLDISVGSIIKKFISSIGSGFGNVFSTVASFTVILVTAPFILFYMLKDGDRLIPAIKRYLPENHQEEVIELLNKMSNTISAYISGQAVECLFVATFTCIGYMIIGVDYAFLFGCIAGITNMIPYLGPYIGLAPAVLVTVFQSPLKALLACIVVLIVQQVDGNIIYPNVIGKSLDIHPLTIIIILLVAGNIAGLLGMILGVPFYAVCKTILMHIFDIVQLNKKDNVELPKQIDSDRE